MNFKIILFFSIALLLEAAPLSASINPLTYDSKVDSEVISYRIRSLDSTNNSQNFSVVNVDCKSPTLPAIHEVINKSGYLVDIKILDANTHLLVPAVFESGYKIAIDPQSCSDRSKESSTIFVRFAIDAKWIDDPNKLKGTNGIQSTPVSIQGSESKTQDFKIDGKERWLFNLGNVKYYLTLNYADQ